MRIALKPKKFRKVRSMLALSNKSKADTYFLRDEMEVIVYSIIGERVECRDVGNYFYQNLSDLGFKKQMTIDSHPTMENVNFLINVIDQKRKEKEGSVISSRTKRNRKKGIVKSISKISKDNSNTSPVRKEKVSVRASELDLNQILLQKLSEQKFETLSFDGRTISIKFK